jgi:hypothetical protein
VNLIHQPINQRCVIPRVSRLPLSHGATCQPCFSPKSSALHFAAPRHCSPGQAPVLPSPVMPLPSVCQPLGTSPPQQTRPDGAPRHLPTSAHLACHVLTLGCRLCLDYATTSWIGSCPTFGPQTSRKRTTMDTLIRSYSSTPPLPPFSARPHAAPDSRWSPARCLFAPPVGRAIHGLLELPESYAYKKATMSIRRPQCLVQSH